MSAKTTDYPFDSLPAFSRSQALLVNALAASLNPKRSHHVLKVLNERAKKWLPGGMKVSLTPVKILGSPDELGEMESRVGLEFFHPSSESNLYLITDPEAVTTLAEAMLGGGAKSPLTPVEMTPLTRGTFEYFILHLLEAWNQAAPDFTLRYRRLLGAGMDEDLSQVQCGLGVLLRGSLSLGSASFSCLILCPFDVFDSLKGLKSPELTEESLKNFDHLRTLLWAEVGRVVLDPVDLQEIQKGDILLLDEVLARFDGKKLSGDIQLGFGEGKGFFLGGIEESEALTVRMDRFFLKEETDYE